MLALALSDLASYLSSSCQAASYAQTHDFQVGLQARCCLSLRVAFKNSNPGLQAFPSARLFAIRLVLYTSM